MYRTLISCRLALVFAVILTVTANLVRAEEAATPSTVTGKPIAADFLIARPLGGVATVLGTGSWGGDGLFPCSTVVPSQPHNNYSWNPRNIP